MTQEVTKNRLPQLPQFLLHFLANAHLTCSIGAGGYFVTTGDTGKEAAKPSVGAREAFSAGPPNYAVQPVDTPGQCLRGSRANE